MSTPKLPGPVALSILFITCGCVESIKVVVVVEDDKEATEWIFPESWEPSKHMVDVPKKVSCLVALFTKLSFHHLQLTKISSLIIEAHIVTLAFKIHHQVALAAFDLEAV